MARSLIWPKTARTNGVSVRAVAGFAAECRTPPDPEIPNSRSPDSRLGRNRETGNCRFPIRPGTGIGVPIVPRIGKSGIPLCVSTTACTILGWMLPWVLEMPTGQLAMSDKQTTMSNDTLEKIVRLRNSRTAVTVLKNYVEEARHVAHDISARLSHWQDPTQAPDTSNLAQSREADGSCTFPLSDPELEPHAACESTGMILAAEHIPSPLRLMLGRHSAIGNRIPRFPFFARKRGGNPRFLRVGVPIRRAGDFLVCAHRSLH